jgi:hypothetical protein
MLFWQCISWLHFSAYNKLYTLNGPDPKPQNILKINAREQLISRQVKTTWSEIVQKFFQNKKRKGEVYLWMFAVYGRFRSISMISAIPTMRMMIMAATAGRKYVSIIDGGVGVGVGETAP